MLHYMCVSVCTRVRDMKRRVVHLFYICSNIVVKGRPDVYIKARKTGYPRQNTVYWRVEVQINYIVCIPSVMVARCFSFAKKLNEIKTYRHIILFILLYIFGILILTQIYHTFFFFFFINIRGIYYNLSYYL